MLQLEDKRTWHWHEAVHVCGGIQLASKTSCMSSGIELGDDAVDPSMMLHWRPLSVLAGRAYGKEKVHFSRQKLSLYSSARQSSRAQWAHSAAGLL